MNDNLKAALEKSGLSVNSGETGTFVADPPPTPPAAVVPNDNEPLKVDPVVPPAPPAPINHSDVLKGIFGDEWSDAEKVKDALSKAKQDPLEMIKDADLRSLVKATNAGIKRDVYEKAAKINLDDPKMTAAEKMTLYVQMKKGFSAEDAKDFVDLTYRLGEDEHADDPSVKLARLNMQEAAVDAEQWLREKKQEYSTPPTERQLKAWEPELPKLVAEYGKINLSAPGVKGEFLYSIDPAKTAEMVDYLKGVIGSTEGFPDPSSDGAKQWVKDAIQREMLHQNRDTIISDYAKWIKAEELKQKVNPSSLPEVPGDNSGKPMTDAQAYEAYLRNKRNGVAQ